MASTISGLLLFSILVGVCAISVAARPCKTIFFITSSSSSSFPADDKNFGNPNFHFLNKPTNSPRLTFFVTEIREFHRTGPVSRPVFLDRSVGSSSDDVVSSKPYYPSDSSSIRDRTMDIMSIVGALLFGVGCGVLTGATMYLIWSLFSPRRFDFGSDSDDEEHDEEKDEVAPSKMGYVAIPTATKAVPPSADEVDAMK